jgi:hypothetical protein
MALNRNIMVTVGGDLIQELIHVWSGTLPYSYHMASSWWWSFSTEKKKRDTQKGTY